MADIHIHVADDAAGQRLDAYLGANDGSTLTPAAAKKHCPPTRQDWYNKVAAQMNLS